MKSKKSNPEIILGVDIARAVMLLWFEDERGA
jgi:hypothetical protein